MEIYWCETLDECVECRFYASMIKLNWANRIDKIRLTIIYNFNYWLIRVFMFKQKLNEFLKWTSVFNNVIQCVHFIFW